MLSVPVFLFHTNLASRRRSPPEQITSFALLKAAPFLGFTTRAKGIRTVSFAPEKKLILQIERGRQGTHISPLLFSVRFLAPPREASADNTPLTEATLPAIRVQA